MTLTFSDLGIIRHMVKHAEQAPEQQRYYGAILPEPSLFLVKDEGVYLMSAGLPADLLHPTLPKQVVVYAEGCHPDLDTDWYETARDVMGGDDSSEPIPTKLFTDALRDPRAKRIRLILTKRTVRVTVLRTYAPEATHV